jgi:hypothetical protein
MIANSHKIVWKDTNKCVKVNNDKIFNGNEAELTDCNSNSLTLNFIIPEHYGMIQLENYKNYCLDIKGGERTIQIWECFNNDNQRFYVKKDENKIQWVHMNKCINVENNKLNIETCNGNKDQRFDFIGSNNNNNKEKKNDGSHNGRADAVCNILGNSNNGHEDDGHNDQHCRDRREIGWKDDNNIVYGDHHWCRIHKVHNDWGIPKINTKNHKVKVLSYNLFWWNLYLQRKSNGNSAGRLMKSILPIDVFGFQECEDIFRIMGDLGDHYHTFNAGRALGMSFDRYQWEIKYSKSIDVGEDIHPQYFGKRSVGMIYMKHKHSDKHLLHVNHHGVLPVNTGGLCKSESVAYNILKNIGANAKENDLIIVTGDFNCNHDSPTIKILETYLNKHVSSTSFSGVDHIFSNSNNIGVTKILPESGSDHQPIMAEIYF